MSSPRRMRIGELAGDLGVNTKTIRYYESIGLFPPPERTRSGYRLYSEEDEARLRFVKAAQSIGLALDEIKEVLAFRERGELPCPYVTDLIGKHADDIERRIRELRQLKRDLRSLEQRARETPPDELARGRICHVIEAASLRRTIRRARPGAR